MFRENVKKERPVEEKHCVAVYAHAILNGLYDVSPVVVSLGECGD